MENTNIFEQASKQKLRFALRGSITTEDLWDLLPAELNTIYKNLTAGLKAESEDSLLGKVKTSNVAKLELQIEIVKHIFASKQASAEAAVAAKAKADQLKRLKEALLEKKDAELGAKTTAELEAMIAVLEGKA